MSSKREILVYGEAQMAEEPERTLGVREDSEASCNKARGQKIRFDYYSSAHMRMRLARTLLTFMASCDPGATPRAQRASSASSWRSSRRAWSRTKLWHQTTAARRLPRVTGSTRWIVVAS